MSRGQTIAIGAGIFLLYSLFRKKQALGNLVFYPHSLKGIKFDGITPVMTLGLAVQNTSNQTFQLNSIAGQIFANTYLIGNIGSFVPQVIPANSQSVIYINARLSLIGIVTDIINQINNGTFTQEIELESNANIDNLQVPIDLKFKFAK